MNKNRIKLTESQLHGIIKKSVKNVLNESMYELKVPFEKAVNGIDEFLDALDENGYMEDERAKKLYKTLMNAIFAIRAFCRHPEGNGRQMSWDPLGW